MPNVDDRQHKSVERRQGSQAMGGIQRKPSLNLALLRRPPLQALQHLRNTISFGLSQRIKLQRGPATLTAGSKDGLFAEALIPEVDRLVNMYGLEPWRECSPRSDFATSLAYLGMLERALAASAVSLPGHVRALDAGCGDWFYVQPLHGLLERFGLGSEQPGRSVRLDGVELDAYALYQGFRSRRDWAAGYMNGLEGARYIAGDVRGYREQVDLAFMLFPFLFSNPDMVQWGLPKRYLQPAALLRHVAGLVKPGGALLIANLGDEEQCEQHRLLAEAGLPLSWWDRYDSVLHRSDRPWFVTVVRL